MILLFVCQETVPGQFYRSGEGGGQGRVEGYRHHPEQQPQHQKLSHLEVKFSINKTNIKLLAFSYTLLLSSNVTIVANWNGQLKEFVIGCGLCAAGNFYFKPCRSSYFFTCAHSQLLCHPVQEQQQILHILSFRNDTTNDSI